MLTINLLDIKSREELRRWLVENHNKEKECWVVVKRGRPQKDNNFWYIDAVEEALCFGWIDSPVKRLNNDSLRKDWRRAKRIHCGRN